MKYLIIILFCFLTLLTNLSSQCEPKIVLETEYVSNPHFFDNIMFFQQSGHLYRYDINTDILERVVVNTSTTHGIYSFTFRGSCDPYESFPIRYSEVNQVNFSSNHKLFIYNRFLNQLTEIEKEPNDDHTLNWSQGDKVLYQTRQRDEASQLLLNVKEWKFYDLSKDSVFSIPKLLDYKVFGLNDNKVIVGSLIDGKIYLYDLLTEAMKYIGENKDFLWRIKYDQNHMLWASDHTLYFYNFKTEKLNEYPFPDQLILNHTPSLSELPYFYKDSLAYFNVFNSPDQSFTESSIYQLNFQTGQIKMVLSEPNLIFNYMIGNERFVVFRQYDKNFLWPNVVEPMVYLYDMESGIKYNLLENGGWFGLTDDYLLVREFADPLPWPTYRYDLKCFEDLVSTLEVDQKNKEVSLRPNPAIDEVELQVNFSIDRYAIYSIDGQLQKTAATSDPKIDIEALPSGVYFIHVFGKEGSGVGRFVKL